MSSMMKPQGQGPDPSMNGNGEGFQLGYDPRLVEGAVLLAIREHPQERDLRGHLDRIYELQDAEDREAAFQAFHAEWFARLGLGTPIELAFEERPQLSASTRGCVVAPAMTRKEEGTDLFVAQQDDGGDGTQRRSIGIQLRPESFLDPDFLLGLLRHEFLHIADMLDPAFGYQPALTQPDGGPMPKRLLQERYRALWDATIDGRLVREGRAQVRWREHRLRDFAQAFPMLGEQTEEAFARFFDTPFHTHFQLLSFAHSPGYETTSKDMYCSLCNSPSHVLEPDPERLPAAVKTWITRDFPDWRPEKGLCPQCADLYRARPLSSSAVSLLPDIT